MRPSAHLLAPLTLLLLSYAFCYSLYTNLFLVAGVPTTKWICTSTISSPPTPFHQCRRGIFWTLTTPGTTLHDVFFPTLSISLRGFIHYTSTSAARGHNSTHCWCSSHPSPSWVSSDCSSSRGRTVPQPSSCKNLAQVVRSRPSLTQMFLLHCIATSPPKSPGCTCTGQQTPLWNRGQGSLAESKAFDVYLVQVSSFSNPSHTQYPLSPIQKPEHQL